ncbi:hypothetical protein ACVQ92_10450 [Staphylococcus aureus]
MDHKKYLNYVIHLSGKIFKVKELLIPGEIVRPIHPGVEVPQCHMLAIRSIYQEGDLQ